MINQQNYIANIGGKPMIIAGKALQSGNAANGGAFILNSQDQQLKIDEIQSLNQQLGQDISVSTASADGQRPIIPGSTIKVLKVS